MSKLISFEDCPYNCVDGKVFNTTLGQMETCPYCAEKRKGIVQDEDNTEVEGGKNIFEILNINEYYRGIEYTFEKVISDTSYLTEESLNIMKESLDNLYSRLSIGEIPKSSYLYNIGSKANAYNFVYPFIIRAYKYGVPTTPVLSTVDIVESQLNLDKGISKEYVDYVNTKLSVVIVNAGTSYLSTQILKGYMQERAKRGNPTIIFTMSKVEGGLLTLVNESEKDSLHLARLVSVVYIQGSEVEKQQGLIENNGGIVKMEDLFKMF